jgi:hypothetical protein
MAVYIGALKGYSQVVRGTHSRGTPGVLLGYSWGTHTQGCSHRRQRCAAMRALRQEGYSRGTPRVLIGYSRVLTGYSQGTDRVVKAAPGRALHHRSASVCASRVPLGGLQRPRGTPRTDPSHPQSPRTPLRPRPSSVGPVRGSDRTKARRHALVMLRMTEFDSPPSQLVCAA